VLPYRSWSHKKVANRSDRPLAIIVLTLFALVALLISRATAAVHPVPLDKNVDAAKCLECHEDKSKGKFVHSAIAMGCLSCHQIRTNKDVTHVILNNPVPYKVCLSCHEDKDATKIHGHVHPPAVRDCMTCHDPHTSGNKNQLLKAESGDKKDNLCLTCHTQGTNVPEKGSRHAALDMGCDACHTTHKVGEKGKQEFDYHLTKAVPALCIDCHDVKDAALIKAHQRQPFAAATCTQCHDPHQSSLPKLMARFTHPPFADKTCEICHSPAKDGKVVLTNADTRALCATCHSDQVDKIDKAIETFTMAGGKQVVQKMEVPGIGWSFIGVDPEPRAHCSHPESFVRPHPGRPHPRLCQTMLPIARLGTRYQYVQFDLAGRQAGHPAHKATAGQRNRDQFVGQGVHTKHVEHRAVIQPRPEQRQHRQVGGRRGDLGPEHHLAQVAQQRLTPPRFGVEMGDAAQLGLDPVILHPALTVEAEILRAGAVGQFTDVLARDAVQPCLPVLAGQGEHRAVRAVHEHRIGFGGTLLAQRIAVVPDRAGVGPRIGCGNCSHASTLRTGGERAASFSPARGWGYSPALRGPHPHVGRAPSRWLGLSSMSSPTGVIVTLDGEVHPPGTPLLHADDLAAVRGDGAFETLLIRDGAACLVESHLQRLTQSAKYLDLPQPDLAGWRRAIDLATREWAAGTAEEGALRLIYSRGREGGSEPTAYVMVSPVPERVAEVRRDGLAAAA